MPESDPELVPEPGFDPAQVGFAIPVDTATASFTVRREALDDWTTALLLPNVDTVYVKGDPAPGAVPDLIEIQVGSETTTLYFTFRSAWADQPIIEYLQVFDSSMSESIRFVPDGQTQSFDFSIPVGSTAATSWYVKIGLPANVGSGLGPWAGGGVQWQGPAPEHANPQVPGAFAYVLGVARRPFTPEAGGSTGGYTPDPGYGSGGGEGGSDDSSQGGYTEITLPPALPFPDTSAGSSTPPDPPDPGLPSPVTKSDDDGLTILAPIAVGPLPVRSAAPLGGVLASPDSFPSVDRHEGARADLAMFDPARALEDPELDPRQVVPTNGDEAEIDAVRILALRGPGGLPMLATALITGVTTEAAAGAEAPNAEAAAAEANAANAAAAAPVQVFAPSAGRGSTTTSAAQSESEAQAQARPSKEPGSNARRRRASVVPGLTLAFALGLSLVLPDLVAALQFTIPARPALRLRWIRRAFRIQ